MIRIEVRGVDRLQAVLRTSTLIAKPLRTFMEAALFTVESEAKPIIPRDTGYLGRSLQTQITGTVGTLRTNAPHALYVHGRPPNPPARSRPHWPPIAAITPWARRHGVSPYVLARAIARRGTKLVPFLTLAVKQSAPAIAGLVRRLAIDIERKAS